MHNAFYNNMELYWYVRSLYCKLWSMWNYDEWQR